MVAKEAKIAKEKKEKTKKAKDEAPDKLRLIRVLKEQRPRFFRRLTSCFPKKNFLKSP